MSSTVAENIIPADVIFNSDQTGLRMVPVNDWTMTTIEAPRKTSFSAIHLNFEIGLGLTVYFVDRSTTKKSTTAKQWHAYMCHTETTRPFGQVLLLVYYLVRYRLRNNIPHCLLASIPHCLLASIYLRHGKNRGTIFLKEDIFAERYFRGRYVRGKMFSREQYLTLYSRKYVLANISQNHFSRN